MTSIACALTARDIERFEKHVDRSGGPDACHLWTAEGYGSFLVGGRKGRVLRAHRLAYELAHGPIGPGLCVLHRCDVPACVNPAHLSVGTHAENMADRNAKGRQARGARHDGMNRRGERHPLSRLSDQQADEVRARCARGDGQRLIARDFGISQSAVSRIRTGSRRPV